MPIYEYTCESCSEQFEKLVRSMSAADEKIACPKCGKTKTSRSFSVFAVGAESGSSRSSPLATAPGMCGRCGGPGPCANG